MAWASGASGSEPQATLEPPTPPTLSPARQGLNAEHLAPREACLATLLTLVADAWKQAHRTEPRDQLRGGTCASPALHRVATTSVSVTAKAHQSHPGVSHLLSHPRCHFSVLAQSWQRDSNSSVYVSLNWLLLHWPCPNVICHPHGDLHGSDANCR